MPVVAQFKVGNNKETDPRLVKLDRKCIFQNGKAVETLWVPVAADRQDPLVTCCEDGRVKVGSIIYSKIDFQNLCTLLDAFLKRAPALAAVVPMCPYPPRPQYGYRHAGQTEIVRDNNLAQKARRIERQEPYFNPPLSGLGGGTLFFNSINEPYAESWFWENQMVYWKANEIALVDRPPWPADPEKFIYGTFRDSRASVKWHWEDGDAAYLVAVGIALQGNTNFDGLNSGQH